MNRWSRLALVRAMSSRMVRSVVVPLVLAMWVGAAAGQRPDSVAPPACARAKTWLLAHQDADGHWDAAGFAKHDAPSVARDDAGLAIHDVTVTALALLALLGERTVETDDRERLPALAAAGWLVRRQRDDGRIGDAPRASPDALCEHALATHAVLEAAALDPERRFRAAGQLALDHLLASRNRDGVWGSVPKDASSNTMTTTWAVPACASAHALRFDMDRSCMERIRSWLAGVTRVDGSVDAAARGVLPPGGWSPIFATGPTECAAATLHAFALAGCEAMDCPWLITMEDRLALSTPEHLGTDLLATRRTAIAFFEQGRWPFTAWSRRVPTLVLATQIRHGPLAGTWEPAFDRRGREGGRVFTTALGLLTLQLYYRYSRLVR